VKWLDLTLPAPAENLACDEALLDLCAEGRGCEILRFWESPVHFVAIGYANDAAIEVNLPACEAAAIPVLRRCTGGGTVLQGPGCLNYALILGINSTGPLSNISTTNKYILERQRAALEHLTGANVRTEGQTDLAVGNRKFSGNAQRRRRDALIFHGSLLLDFDIGLIEKYLRRPSTAPAYRADRGHAEFLTNLDASRESVKQALREEWSALEEFHEIPRDKIQSMIATQYSTSHWTPLPQKR